MERTQELANLVGIPEENFYTNCYLTEMAQKYAQYRLEIDKNLAQREDEIRRALLTRLDEVYHWIQTILAITCHGVCAECKDGWMCARSTK